MKKILLSLLFVYSTLFGLSQIIYKSTVPTFTRNNGSGGITFNLSTNKDIYVKDVKCYFTGSASRSVQLWYSPTAISGTPSATTASGWTNLGTITVTPPANTIQSCIPINLFMAAGSNYGFHVKANSVGYMTWTTAMVASVSDATITIWGGNNRGYGGANHIFHPRFFVGTVGYEIANRGMNNAATTKFTPDSPCAGTDSIKAYIKNDGQNQIDSVWVNWEVNGIAQTPYHHKVLLDTIGGTGFNSAIVYLGNHTFVSGQEDTIKVWTSMPNGVVDTVNGNDTVLRRVKPSLSGIYTIGTSVGKDYPSFSAAQIDLDTIGICGPVIFNVEQGTYNEQIKLGKIKGSSSVNTILFQADPINTLPVTMTFASTNPQNYSVKFDSAQYITFDDIDMTATNLAYSRLLFFDNSNHHITIKNCVFTGMITTLNSVNNAIIHNEGGTSSLSHNLTFDSNELKNGSIAFSMIGGNLSFSNAEDSLIITNNIISNFFHSGIFSNYQKNVLIENNVITQSSLATSSGTGIQLYYNHNAKVRKNKITLDAALTNYGLYLYYPSGLSTNPVEISNNMISTTGKTSVQSHYGIYMYYGNRTNIYHNSINVRSGSVGSAGFYTLGVSSPAYSQNNIVNNIITNSGTGYAMQLISGASAASYINSLDYNLYNSSSTNKFMFGFANHATLASWQTATGKEVNSLFGGPLFLTATDLHISPSSPAVNSGNLLASIPTDIDGQIRSAAEIGADEISVTSFNDASTLSMIPNSACQGIDTVKATIANLGLNQIDSVWINWRVNGILQTPVHYKNILDTFGGVFSTSAQVTLGTHNFLPGATVNFKIWTSMPNGVVDTSNANDTIYNVLIPMMSGTYTIGTSVGKDYATFSAAALDLATIGICGPVIFNVEQGTYNEQVTLGGIVGSNSVNTILFRSDPVNTLPVNLTYASTGFLTNWTLRFDDATYITFDDIDMAATGTSYARVIFYDNNNNKIAIKNCTINGTSATTTSNNAVVIYNEQGTLSLSHNLTFDNNIINGGSYSFYMYGGSSSSSGQEDSLVITNNTVNNFYYYGLNSRYLKNATISNNTFQQVSTATSLGYGLYFYYCNSIKIKKNVINTDGNSTNWGIYLFRVYGSSLHPTEIENNMITTSAKNVFATNYGIYMYLSRYNLISHNSVNVRAGNINSAAFYTYGLNSTTFGQNELKNNIFRNSGSGYAIYANGTGTTSASYLTAMNYNLFSGSSSNLYRYGLINYATLAQWRTATGKGVNSVSGNPQYVSATDLHLTSTSAAIDTGFFITSITTDIDGHARPYGTKTEIGADEFNSHVIIYDTVIVSICDSFTTPLGGVTHYSTGYYYDTIASITVPLDSIRRTYDVTIYYVNNVSVIATACDSFVTPAGKTYFTTGIHVDSLLNIGGCDSVVTYNLTINNATSSTQTLTVCDSLISPSGKIWTTSAIYYDTILNSQNCDSSMVFNLTVTSSYSNTVTISVCDSFLLPGGTTVTTSGNYNDTLTTVGLCDSIIITRLTVNSSYSTTQNIQVCDSFLLPKGSVATTSGIYRDTFQTVSFCDSIIITNLTINYSSTSIQTLIVCDSLTSPSGKKWYTSGIYLDTINNAAGCDSLMTFNLTINNFFLVTNTITVCDSFALPSSLTVFTTGIYRDTFTSVTGCDSIIVTNLTVNSTTNSAYAYTSCDSIVSPSGKIWTTSGVYNDTIANAAGCDSNMVFTITINYATTVFVTDTACDNYTLPGGSGVTTSGIYRDTLSTSKFCDSIIVTNLFIKHKSTSTQNIIVCDTLISPSGKIWTTTGTHLDTIINAVGCDSLMTINLTLNSKTVSTSAIVCDSFMLPTGVIVTASGTYQDTIPTSMGCDSIIITNLTINYSNSATHTIVACGTYTSPSGKIWTTTGTYLDTILNISNCDSNMVFILTVNPVYTSAVIATACDSFALPSGTIKKTTGIYPDTLTTVAGCDSIIIVSLTINYSINVNTSHAICFTDSVVVGTKVYKTPGVYRDSLLTKNGCDSILVTTITMVPIIDATIDSFDNVCENESSFFFTSPNSGGKWIGNGIDTITGEFDPATAGAGTHTIMYTAPGCGATDTVQITVYPTPVINSVYNDDTCANLIGSININMTIGSPIYTYSWSNGDTVSSISNLKKGNYSVTIRDANNCVVRESFTIINISTEDCYYQIYIPNVFSPDGNGHNDKLYVRGSGVETVHFTLFNRWGNLIFETTDMDIGWDGVYKGLNVNSGAFVYMVSGTFEDGTSFKESGTVTVVR